jgi:tyrosyl-tRNA synthetase
LIKKADGGKFGKTEKGNVWLDPSKTSPYQFFQFWLNASDTDAEGWIKIFTFLSREKIEQLISDHLANPAERILQKALAREVTLFVHGEEEYQKAIETTAKLFSSQDAPAESLSIEDLESMEGVVKFDFDLDRITSGLDVVSFLSETGILASKGEARKLIQNGGISINRKKVTEVNMQISDEMLLHRIYILVQKGKKNYFLVRGILPSS